MDSDSSSSPQDVAMDSDGEAPKIAASTRNMLEEDLAVSGSDSDSSAAGSAKHSGSARSRSPKSVRSGASSRSSRKSGSRSRSASSGSASPGSPGSAKRSSRSNSPKSNRSGGSRHSSPRSRASSSSGSRSPSPAARRGSDKGSRKSRSGSPRSVGSGSGRGSAKHSSRSGSRSGSESPGSPRSAKRSPAKRSRSGSPKSQHSDESDGGERIPERSPPRFDPTDSESGESKPGSPKSIDARDQEDKENEAVAAEAKAEEEEETLPETRIDVEIPKITTDLGKSVHFVKLPNFLSVETRPFDPSTYEDEIDDEETLDEEGRARLKLKVENTIRWREKFNEKGAFVKESNARFVRWSDGSLSLHLGDEIFNVERQALHGDHNHLFIRQGTGLQGQAVFRTKLTFRPHSTESFTHRKMTMSLADRSTKAQGIKVLSTVGADPEAQRDVLIKKEEDKLRASVRRENKQRRVRERGTKGLSTSYLDDEYSEEDNSISLAAIKNRYKKGGVRAQIYSSDDDEGSDLEQGRKLEKAKRLKDSEDEDDDGSDNDVRGRSSPAEKGDSPMAGPSSTTAAVTSAVDSD